MDADIRPRSAAMRLEVLCVRCGDVYCRADFVGVGVSFSKTRVLFFETTVRTVGVSEWVSVGSVGR